MTTFRKLPVAIALAAVVLTGCEQAAQAPAMPAPTVEVAAVTAQDYQPVKRYSGRIEAIEDINISAQVSGYLTQRLVEDGQIVEAGTPLFEIDPRPYQAALAAAKATLAEAKASRDIAQVNLKRNKELLGKGSVSQSDIDNLTATLAMADARVMQAQAGLEKAELDLSHTTVTAPIAGQVGAANAGVGDLVSPQSGALITLVQLDPVRTSFRISERERLAMVTNNLMSDEKMAITLDLGQGKHYDHEGTLSFIDNRIDLATGTLALHADFANPEHMLAAGQFVQVQVRPHQPLNGLVIPNAAVQSDQQGSFVMVVDGDNTVERRNVDLGERLGQQIVVLSNLAEGERIVTAGLHRARVGAQVQVAGDVAQAAGN
ncbi:efflux RND transporter periplasmic adaptor subunit [Ferrimonas marina]|uniref:Membrane fusion protein, multidrug efflux system n=1 Tax=Ferrimonas marina TaxID=299255 RepID=A0A1M5S7C6_9GAMM|nr:efflux RND transporter periplasmic adaptor subunit [Ferrimonas marina]SHH34355.1 membrane fusion protein, multidrug efflux system [Ferrimonas marina]